MEERQYTLAMWRVKEDEIDQFVEAWSNLATAFESLPAPPLWGTLIQSHADSTLFYSFGPWRSVRDIEQMRNDPAAQNAIAIIVSHCVQATPGGYRQVKHVDLTRSPEARA